MIILNVLVNKKRTTDETTEVVRYTNKNRGENKEASNKELRPNNTTKDDINDRTVSITNTKSPRI